MVIFKLWDNDAASPFDWSRVEAPFDLTSTPLGPARTWLLDAMADKGAACPCCTQFAKIYKRTITSAMAAALVKFERTTRELVGDGWVHVPTFLLANCRRGSAAQGGDFVKLVYWNFLEPLCSERDDSSPRTGYYRLRPGGRDFVYGLTTVAKYACVFNERVLRFDGPQISIQMALGKKFDYRELMEPSGDE